MVERISGWRTSDGRMFDNQKQALIEEALLQLTKLDIFNEATRKAVVLRADKLVEILGPVAHQMNQEAAAAPKFKERV